MYGFNLQEDFYMRKLTALVLCACMLFMLGACTIHLGDGSFEVDGNGIGNGPSLTDSENVNLKADKAEKLVVSNGAGDMRFSVSNTDEVVVEAEKKVRGVNDDKKREILDNMRISVEQRGKEVSVEVKCRDTGEDFWKWKNRMYKTYSVSIDFEIRVPEGMTAYTINDGAGNIRFKGLKGSVVINNGAGNVEFDDMELRKDSTVNLGAGNCDLDISLDSADKLTINNGAGNLNLRLPADSKFTLKTESGFNQISGSFINGSSSVIGKTERTFNGGGCKVDVRMGAGNIVVDKR